MQRHRYRSEFMFVADGQLTNMNRTTKKHNYTMIDKGEWHKLENKGKKETITSFIIWDLGGISSSLGFGAIEGLKYALTTT